MFRQLSHFLASVVLVGASACNQKEMAEEEKNQAAPEATPQYAQRDGDVYMYVGVISPEALSRGESASIVNVRYLGRRGEAHQIEFIDDAGRRLSIYECSSPCRIAKETANDGSHSKLAINEGSITAAAFADATNGLLKVSKAAVSPSVSSGATPINNTTTLDDGSASQSSRLSGIVPPKITADWRDYRTRISEGWTTAPTLGGRYVVIEVGCGAGCRWAMVGDHQTGQIYGLGLGGEDQMYLDLKFDDSSNRIRASWSDSDGCVSETYTWTGSSLRSSGDKSVVPQGDSFSCS